MRVFMPPGDELPVGQHFPYGHSDHQDGNDESIVGSGCAQVTGNGRCHHLADRYDDLAPFFEV